ncbi:MAG: hypothetical protein Alis3KO_34170 [Aliiglaciecola sp.]
MLVNHGEIISGKLTLLPDDIRKTWSAFKFYSLLILILAIASYSAFKYGNQHYAKQQNEIEMLQHTMSNLDAENQRLTQRLNVLGVELEVQRLAALNLQNSISEGLQRETQLQQEISFYQRVMAPELKQEGFVIEAFDIAPSVSERGFRYELVLMQQDKIKNVVKGTIEVTLIGSEQGKPKRYALPSLVEAESDPLTFSFKYFQVINGEFILPEGFAPEKIQVKAEVFQFRRKRGDLERTFDWQIEQMPIIE